MLQKNMYVKTTYGIGKITSVYIIYDNDGSFWHIACITDKYVKNKGYIEIGIYAKNETYGKHGNFLRVFKPGVKYDLWEDYETSPRKKKIDRYLKKCGTRYVCYVNYGKERIPRDNSGLYDDHKLIQVWRNYNEINNI